MLYGQTAELLMMSGAADDDTDQSLDSTETMGPRPPRPPIIAGLTLQTMLRNPWFFDERPTCLRVGTTYISTITTLLIYEVAIVSSPTKTDTTKGWSFLFTNANQHHRPSQRPFFNVQ